MIPKRTGPEDTSDADRADEEAASMAAERIRSGAAEESEDGTEALESLGISLSAQAIQERLGHEPATIAEFETVHGAVKPADGEG